MTAAEIAERDAEAARNLPTETKREFWRLMLREGKNLGEARDIVGIELGVAGQLVLQCHDTAYIPKRVEDIV